MKQHPSEDRRCSILAIGSNLVHSGFSRVMRSVLGQLKCWYDIHYIGIAYKGPVVTEAGLTLYPSNLKGGDVWGVYQGKDAIATLKPDIVFLMNDFWMLPQYLKVFEPYRHQFKLIAYVPVDGKLPDDQWVQSLQSVDRFAVYSQFGKAEVEQSVARLAQAGIRCQFQTVDAIPLGVDTTAFYPLSGSVEAQFAPPGRLPAKQQLFPDEPDLADAFWVLNANRPQPRKRIDLTLKSFALFACEKPANVKLYLHHAIMNAEERQDIVNQAEQLGILDRLQLSPVMDGRDRITDDDLNLIYNACDVGINTAMGEGWGLVSLEHAATGAAQIVPKHSACSEIWTGAAALLDPTQHYVPPFSPLEMAEIDPNQAAETLERLYCDRIHRQTLSIAAHRTATQPHYRWDRIAQQWHQLL